MKSKQRILKPVYLITGVILIVALSGYGIFTLAKKYNLFSNNPDIHQVSSLDEWQARSQLSGFELLDRVDLPDHYICVYDTGLDEVAICYHQKQSIDNIKSSFVVYDDQNQIVHDNKRKQKTTELNNPRDKYAIRGTVLPIKKDYNGMIHIKFKADYGSGYKPVYHKSLPFNKSDEKASDSND